MSPYALGNFLLVDLHLSYCYRNDLIATSIVVHVEVPLQALTVASLKGRGCQDQDVKNGHWLVSFLSSFKGDRSIANYEQSRDTGGIKLPAVYQVF